MAEGKTSRMRGKWGLVVKLIAGIGALTGAVERYIDIQHKNELVYEALSSKVNNMAEALSEVKGQQQVMMVFLAQKYHLDMPEAAPAPASEEGAGEAAGEEAMAPAEPEDTHSGVVSVTSEVGVAKAEKAKSRMNIQAFENLPASVDDLVQQQAR